MPSPPPTPGALLMPSGALLLRRRDGLLMLAPWNGRLGDGRLRAGWVSAQGVLPANEKGDLFRGPEPHAPKGRCGEKSKDSSPHARRCHHKAEESRLSSARVTEDDTPPPVTQRMVLFDARGVWLWPGPLLQDDPAATGRADYAAFFGAVPVVERLRMAERAVELAPFMDSV